MSSILDQTFSRNSAYQYSPITHANATGTSHYAIDQDQATDAIVHNAVDMFLSPLLLLYIQNQLFF